MEFISKPSSETKPQEANPDIQMDENPEDPLPHSKNNKNRIICDSDPSEGKQQDENVQIEMEDDQEMRLEGEEILDKLEKELTSSQPLE